MKVDFEYVWIAWLRSPTLSSLFCQKVSLHILLTRYVIQIDCLEMQNQIVDDWNQVDKPYISDLIVSFDLLYNQS